MPDSPDVPANAAEQTLATVHVLAASALNDLKLGNYEFARRQIARIMDLSDGQASTAPSPNSREARQREHLRRKRLRGRVYEWDGQSDAYAGEAPS